MPEKKSRFVRTCQQLLAVGTVAALAAPTAGVVSLDIVGPAPQPGPEAVTSDVALVASEPVEPEVAEVPLKGVDKAGLEVLTSRPAAQRRAEDRLAVLSSPEKVEGFATVGVTWDQRDRLEEDEITVSVRTQQDGEWSAWESVEYHDEHGPTPGSAEARRARQGTEPILVGYVDEVQVKITTADGEVPADAALAVIDPKDAPAPRLEAPAIDTAHLPAEGAVSLSSATAPVEETTAGDEAAGDETAAEEPDSSTEPEGVSDEPAPEGDGVLVGSVGVTPKPKIFSRAQWGADERMRDKSSLSYYEVHAGFVHHTVNANGYTREQVPSMLRGIYAFHTQSRGWSDIGYNFLVDRFGRIWEGRYGGVDRPVVGAHTLGYNEYSFAMSALGNFDTAKPSRRMIRAYGRLFAWKLSLHGVSASSTRQRVGSRYFPAINGHRDAGSTACPGGYLYARLGRIRTLATQNQAPFTARTRSTDVAGSSWPDLVVRDADTNEVRVVRTGGQTNFVRPQLVADGWQRMDLVAAPHDLDGDGIPDVVARDARTKLTGVYLGTPQGTLRGPVIEPKRFARADLLTGALDITRNGNNDLVARMAGTSNLWVYPGKGNGRFGKRRRLSTEWADYDLTAGVGDLDGDRRNDLVARDGKTLYLVPGKRRRIGTPVKLPGRWGHYSDITGAGDVTNDGKPDLVAKVKRNGLVYVLPGDGDGRFSHRLGPFRRFQKIDHLAVVGNLAGNAGSDLIGLTGKGRLRVFPNNGARNVEAVTDTGRVLPGADLLLNVEDWNGDGFGDLMVRTSRGVMHLRLGNGNGGFGKAIRAGTGWARVRLVAAVGDITGDGHPDLMGQPAGRAMRIYPGNGSRGFLPSYVAHSAISSDRHTGLGLWNGDGSPDSLLRRDGALLLYPGNGPGGLMNPVEIASGVKQYDWLQSVGDATGNGRPDLLARQRSNGKLWLLPGTRKGFGARRLVAAGFGGYDLSS